MNAQSTVCASLLPSIISFPCPTSRIVDAHWEDKSLENMTKCSFGAWRLLLPAPREADIGAWGFIKVFPGCLTTWSCLQILCFFQYVSRKISFNYHDFKADQSKYQLLSVSMVITATSDTLRQKSGWFVYVLEVDGKRKQTSWFSSQPRNREEEKNVFSYHDTFSVLFWISWDFSQTLPQTCKRKVKMADQSAFVPQIAGMELYQTAVFRPRHSLRAFCSVQHSLVVIVLSCIPHSCSFPVWKWYCTLESQCFPLSPKAYIGSLRWYCLTVLSWAGRQPCSQTRCQAFPLKQHSAF